jgi:3-phenylpropionate/cinnamic acid dioxygenase small subunit
MPNTLLREAAPAVIAGLTQFLNHEARLLDSARFDEWLALFTADATYWLPLEQGQRDPFETCSIIYDDRTLLEARVRQYRHPRAHARTPFARTVHQIGNVMLLSEDPGRGELTVASTLVLVEYRPERQRVFGALCEHRLRASGDSWQIAAKRVDLANAEAELDGLAILF